MNPPDDQVSSFPQIADDQLLVAIPFLITRRAQPAAEPDSGRSTAHKQGLPSWGDPPGMWSTLNEGPALVSTSARTLQRRTQAANQRTKGRTKSSAQLVCCASSYRLRKRSIGRNFLRLRCNFAPEDEV